MKRILVYIVQIALSFVFPWLVGAFAMWSLDPGTWDSWTRGFFSIFIFIGVGISSLEFSVGASKDKSKNK